MRIKLDQNAKRRQLLIIAFALAHLLASCFYEPVLFGSAAQAALSSGSFGSVTVLAASKLIGALLIWLFWSALIRLFAGSYPKSAVLSFFALFAVSIILIAIQYPQSYRNEPDNLLNVQAALAYRPAYWHHYLTGSFYAGCYMLFPHPVSLMLVQSAFFSALIASLYDRLHARYGGRRAWTAFLLLIVPVSYHVQFSPYRNCLYTILCMFACSELLFLWLDQEKPPLSRRMLLGAVFSLIAVWRSEGILLFLLLPLGLWLACRGSFRQIALLAAASAALAALLWLPQSVGMAQDGNSGDYKIVSTMNALQDIYNASDFQADYEGAEADTAQIERFVPKALLQEYGLEGYRAYNLTNGRSMNDSGQSQEQIDAFIGAYARITLHNLPAFIRSQGNRFLFAMKFPEVLKKSEFSGEHTALPQSTVVSTAFATEQDMSAFLERGAFWRAKPGSAAGELEESLRAQIGNWLYQYDAKTRRASIVVRALLPVAALAIGIIASKQKRSIFPVLLLLVLAAELGAVVLMAPEGWTAYYYPVLFCGYLFVLILAPGRAGPRRPPKSEKG